MPAVHRYAEIVRLVLTLTACVSSEGIPRPAESAIASGRVTSDGGASAGARVRAYTLDADGALTAASPLATTGPDGRYDLDVTISERATALVVRVEEDARRSVVLGRAAVDEDLERGEGVVLAPIDGATTYAARVVIAIEARETVSVERASVVSLFLSPAASARIAHEGSDASVADGAAAVASARDAFLLSLTRSSYGAGSIPLALEHAAGEEARLAARLDAAEGETEIDAAYATHLAHQLSAISSAGFTTEDLASASLVAASALDVHLGSHVSEGRSELHAFAAFAVTSAVDLGLAGSIDSPVVLDESARLRASLAAAARSGASAEETSRVWARYAACLDDELRSRAGLDGTMVTRLTAETRSAARALASDWATRGAPATRVDAMLAYRAEVSSDAHLTALTDAGLMQSRAWAVLDALADVSASTIAR